MPPAKLITVMILPPEPLQKVRELRQSGVERGVRASVSRHSTKQHGVASTAKPKGWRARAHSPFGQWSAVI